MSSVNTPGSLSGETIQHQELAQLEKAVAAEHWTSPIVVQVSDPLILLGMALQYLLSADADRSTRSQLLESYRFRSLALLGDIAGKPEPGITLPADGSLRALAVSCWA